MLMLFPTLQVPGLEDIEFYPDSKDPNRFYALRSIPQLARDPEGNPMMSFVFIERDAERVTDTSENLVELQLGQLLFTTDLGLSGEEFQLAADHIKKIRADEKNVFNRLYWVLLKKKRPEIKPEDMPEPKLSTVSSWKKGTARLEILEGMGDTFNKSTSTDVKPSLVGSNSAAFYATFGVEGSQMMYDALTKNYVGAEEEITPLQAIIRYDLTGYGLIPSLDIKVRANSREVYSSLKTNWDIYSKSYQANIEHGHHYFLGKKLKHSYRNGNKVVAHETHINTMVENMWDNKVIDIQMNDFSNLGLNSSESDELHNQIKTTLLNMITNTIIPQFFEQGFVDDLADRSKENEEDSDEESTDIGILTKRDKRRNRRQYQSYYLNESVDITRTKNIYFHFKENRVVDFIRFPNGSLAVNLTEQERKDVIKKIDIGSPLVEMLTVSVAVNADFVQDNIHSIIVNLVYDEINHESGKQRKKAKSYMFKTGEEVFMFRATMARDADGKLLDTYNANAKINYKGTAQAPPEIKLNNITDKALVVSYEKLGFITVKVSSGDIDWKVISDVVVDLEYTAASNKPDTKKELRLTKEEPSGSWKCFQYGNKSKEYKYRVKYLYHDGSEAELQQKRDTKGELIIDDNLIGRLRSSFDVIIDKDTVDAVKLEIVYTDTFNDVKEEYNHWFKETDTFDWVMRLREGGSKIFKYRYVTIYKDDMKLETKWENGEDNGDIPTFQAKRFEQSLLVDGADIDWDTWKRVYVNVEYVDDKNDYQISERIKLSENKQEEEFSILAFSKNPLKILYSIRFAGREGERYEIESQQIKGRNPVLIIDNPVLQEAE